MTSGQTPNMPQQVTQRQLKMPGNTTSYWLVKIKSGRSPFYLVMFGLLPECLAGESPRSTPEGKMVLRVAQARALTRYGQCSKVFCMLGLTARPAMHWCACATCLAHSSCPYLAGCAPLSCCFEFSCDDLTTLSHPNSLANSSIFCPKLACGTLKWV